jgi:hypothetical protein
MTATGNQGKPSGLAAAPRQQGTRDTERRLFQRMQALEDAIAYRHARTAAPCPDCQPAPGPACDDHGRDLELIGEYRQTLQQTDRHLQRFHAARLQARPLPRATPVTG